MKSGGCGEWGVWGVGDEGINTTQTQLQGFLIPMVGKFLLMF